DPSRSALFASMPTTILLASASPRRRAILETLGHRVIVAPVDIDEDERAGETPAAYLERIVAGTPAAARRLAVQHDAPLTLLADTIVAVDGVILHKPIDDADGARMLRALSART